jgi:hypothetical protein
MEKKKLNIAILISKIMKFSAIIYVVLKSLKGALELINTDNIDISVNSKQDETKD